MSIKFPGSILKSYLDTMISDVKLQQHSGIDYKINGKTIKIGDLTDGQLELGFSFLKNKFKRTAKQKEQLIAIKHVLEHRCNINQEKLIEECYKSSKGNLYTRGSTSKKVAVAEKASDLIMSWLSKLGQFKPELIK